MSTLFDPEPFEESAADSSRATATATPGHMVETTGRIPTMDEVLANIDTSKPLTFTCPRCQQPAAERFYGPCADCRAQLRGNT